MYINLSVLFCFLIPMIEGCCITAEIIGHYTHTHSHACTYTHMHTHTHAHTHTRTHTHTQTIARTHTHTHTVTNLENLQLTIFKGPIASAIQRTENPIPGIGNLILATGPALPTPGMVWIQLSLSAAAIYTDPLVPWGEQRPAHQTVYYQCLKYYIEIQNPWSDIGVVARNWDSESLVRYRCVCVIARNKGIVSTQSKTITWLCSLIPLDTIQICGELRW